MTQEQIEHVRYLQVKFSTMMEEKYKAGVIEHGGNIWEMEVLTLLLEALNENIDQFVYLMAAIDKITNSNSTFLELRLAILKEQSR